MESQQAFDAKQTAYKVEVPRYKSAQEQVAQARAALKRARVDLSKTTIYAPMSGTVSELKKEAGEIVLGSQFQSDLIMVIADLTVMEAQVNVDENDIVNIKLGQDAEVQVDALPGQKLAGVVREIGSSANSAGQGTTEQKTEFEIKIGITTPPETLGRHDGDRRHRHQDERSRVQRPAQCVALRTVDQLAKKAERRTPPATSPIATVLRVVFTVENVHACSRSR
jgi:HlyD family secretion protein